MLSAGTGSDPSHQNKIVSDFKANIDPGLNGERVLVVMCANSPWDIEGPFTTRISTNEYVPLPVAEDFITMIRHYCTYTEHEVKLPEFDVTDEELADLAQTAEDKLFGLRELISSCNAATKASYLNKAKTTFALLNRIFQAKQSGTDKKAVEKYDEHAGKVAARAGKVAAERAANNTDVNGASASKKQKTDAVDGDGDFTCWVPLMDSDHNDEDNFYVGIFDDSSPEYQEGLVSVRKVPQRWACQRGTCRGRSRKVISCVRAHLELRIPNDRAEIETVFNGAFRDCLDYRLSLDQKYGEDVVTALFEQEVKVDKKDGLFF
jgi:hypothetical protein